MTPSQYLLLLPALAISVHGAVVYDLGTTALDGSAGENTYLVSNLSGAALGYNAGPSPTLGFTVGTVSGTNTSYIVGYFGSQSLTNVGDKITLSISFSGTRNATNQAFRVGLYDGAAPLTGNITNSNGSSTFSGYTGYSASYGTNVTPDTNNEFKQRNLTNNNLFSSSAVTSFNGAGEPDFTSSLGSTGAVTLTFSIEKTSATSVKLETSYGASTYSVVDSSGIATSFSAFAIYAEKPTATTVGPNLTFTDISIITSSASPVPEPASVALLSGMAGLAAFALRRRPRR